MGWVWYMRALSDVENIGSKNSEGSKIYLNAQTWAVLGDVADAEKLPKDIKKQWIPWSMILDFR